MPPPTRLDDCLAKLESPPLSYRAIAKKEVVVREYCQSLPPGGSCRGIGSSEPIP